MLLNKDLISSDDKCPAQWFDLIWWQMSSMIYLQLHVCLTILPFESEYDAWPTPDIGKSFEWWVGTRVEFHWVHRYQLELKWPETKLDWMAVSMKSRIFVRISNRIVQKNMMLAYSRHWGTFEWWVGTHVEFHGVHRYHLELKWPESKLDWIAVSIKSWFVVRTSKHIVQKNLKMIRVLTFWEWVKCLFS